MCASAEACATGRTIEQLPDACFTDLRDKLAHLLFVIRNRPASAIQTSAAIELYTRPKVLVLKIRTLEWKYRAAEKIPGKRTPRRETMAVKVQRSERPITAIRHN